MARLDINEYYKTMSSNHLNWKDGIIKIVHNITDCPVDIELINEGIREICRMYNSRFPSLKMEFIGNIEEPVDHEWKSGVVLLNWVDVAHVLATTGQKAFGYVRNHVGFDYILESNLSMRYDAPNNIKKLLKIIMHELYHVVGGGHINIFDTLMGTRPINYNTGAFLFPGDIGNLTWLLNGAKAAPAIFDPSLVRPEMEVFIPCILDKITNKDYYWARLEYAGKTWRRPEHMSDLPFERRHQWKVAEYGHFDDIFFFNIKEYIGPDSNVSLVYLHKRLRAYNIYNGDYFIQLDKLRTGRWLLTYRKENQ